MGYRPDGLRAWKQVNGGPLTYFLYDGERLTMEFQLQSNGTALCTRWYGWGAAGLEQICYPCLPNQPTIFYAFDPQGNLVNRLQNAAVLDLACFDAFGDWVGDFSYIGNVGIWIDPYSDPIGWGGQWGAYTDTPGYAGVSLGGARHAGLILLTHRYYNPDTGRFLTRDPMGYEGGVNVYAYTRNNPVMQTDPSGLDPGDDELSDDDITPFGKKGANAQFLRAVHTGAEGGKTVLNTAAAFNPICNTGTVVSGTNMEGKQVGWKGRAWALVNLIPWGKVGEIIPFAAAAQIIGTAAGDSGKALALGRTEGGAWLNMTRYLIQTHGARGFFTIGAGASEIERGMQAAGSIHFDLAGADAAFMAQRSRYTAQEWEYLLNHHELWERTQSL